MKKVKKVVKYKAFVGSNDEILREFKSGLQEYDLRGNLIKEISFSNNGAIDTANGYAYDEKDRLIEEIHYYEEETGEVIRYNLDETGRRLSVETEYADGSTSVKTYHRSGNSLSIQTKDEDGDLEAEEIVKLDDKGNVLEESYFDEDRNLERKFVNVYDDGHLASRTEYGEHEEFIRKVVLEYDTKGNAVSEVHLNRKDDLIDRIEFVFNDQGNRTSWKNSRYLHKTTFDEDQRPILEERLNRINNLVEEFTQYTYDEEGRILSEKTFSMGEEYELEPGAVTRTRSDFILNRYQYEFFEE